MKPPTGIAPSAPSAPAVPPGSPLARADKLRKAASQLEGVFVQELYKAMRATVPTDGPFSGGSGEEMFTGMMDEHLAAETPKQWHHGLGEAVYRQLARRLPASQQPDSQSAAAATGPHPAMPAMPAMPALAPALPILPAAHPSPEDGR